MAKTKTSSTVKNRYNAKVYDQLPIRVPKGKKETIQEFAKSKGKSLNCFVNDAIDKEMESTDTTEVPVSKQPAATKDGE